MGKKLCKKDKNGSPDNAKYRCKSCDRMAKKENKLCKPKEI
jgi:hypothetical protein